MHFDFELLRLRFVYAFLCTRSFYYLGECFKENIYDFVFALQHVLLNTTKTNLYNFDPIKPIFLFRKIGVNWD